MSHTIEVLPTEGTIPTFGEVVSLATTHLHAYLSDIGINARPAIQFELRIDPEPPTKPPNDHPFQWWGSEEYAWFYFDAVGGGTEAYCAQHEDLDREVWEEAFAKPRPSVLAHEGALRAYLHGWGVGSANIVFSDESR